MRYVLLAVLLCWPALGWAGKMHVILDQDECKPDAEICQMIYMGTSDRITIDGKPLDCLATMEAAMKTMDHLYINLSIEEFLREDQTEREKEKVTAHKIWADAKRCWRTP